MTRSTSAYDGLRGRSAAARNGAGDSRPAVVGALLLSTAAAMAVLGDENVRTRLAAAFTWRGLSPTPGGPAIPTSLTAAEGAYLQHIAAGGDVAEFGAAYGYSTVMMALSARHVWSIDPHSALSDSAERQRAYLVAYGVADAVSLVLDTSGAFCADARTASLDLVFIDGDHSYVGTTADLVCAARLVRPGGAIAVHDYTRLGRVRHAVSDWAAGREVTTVIDSMAVVRV